MKTSSPVMSGGSLNVNLKGVEEMNTGIFIRAIPLHGEKYESVDIGDPRLRANELLIWLATQSDEGVLRAINRVREVTLVYPPTPTKE